MQHKDPVLRTWLGLNEHLQTADEAECNRLLKCELKGPRKSKIILLRLHSRLNLVRAAREREELIGKVS